MIDREVHLTIETGTIPTIGKEVTQIISKSAIPQQHIERLFKQQIKLSKI